ncbi:hypothetical protein RRG08_031859 [Elysia crispata]|uniref:Cystic fibrosis transmembrane conductance regulator n=1 Tax=Elysia crispata TaxID=231223 RepID=A0AAE1E7I3_9GAST|nr:hypothetical protein RRG08_031859 [Elysia crispata]
MDESLRHDNPNPILTANPLSKLIFWWQNPLFRKGYKGWLEESDMYNVCPSDSSKTTGEKLNAAWNKELERQKYGKDASFLRALLRVFGLQYMFYGFIALIEELIKLGQPVLLAEFLDFFTPGSTTSDTEAWLYATAVVLSSVVLFVFHHPYFFGTARIGMRARVSSCALIYQKSLRLSNKSLKESSVGHVVNLMSNDVARFDWITMSFHFLWVGPTQCLVALIYLWYRLGPEVMAALVMILLLMPTQLLMGKLFSKFRRETAVLSDNRVKVMNEIISGIRIIKLYCWEKPFGRLVENLRRLEVKQLRRTKRIQACIMGPFFATNQVSIFLFILAYILTDRENDISPGTVFMVMGVVQCLRLTCGLHVPAASQHLAEVMIGINRIQKFLMLEELQKVTDKQKQARHGKIVNGLSGGNLEEKLDYSVDLRNLTAKWEDNSALPSTLEDITVKVRPGSLVAVIGPVGSGKTSLLMTILGELPIQSGSVRAQGKIAYVSQHPWIFSGSLRQNILFGESFEKARYDKIIRISALSRDLSILPKGDVTLIGDRGVTLSGGQRARVSLARALYMDADIYLLDDPLAAVDTTVGKYIFDKCIMKYLRDKPRILVTHQIQLLPVADNIVVLTQGHVVGQGTYSDLSKSGVDFSELLKCSEEKTAEIDTQNQDSLGNQTISWATSDSKLPRTDSVTSLDSLGKEYVPDSVQLPEEEERETGAIDLQVFISYFKAGASICLFVTLVLFLLLAQVFYVVSDWWLARWATKIEDRLNGLQDLSDYNITTAGSVVSTSYTVIEEVDNYFNLYVYAALILGLLASSFTRAFMFFKLAVTAGENLHNMMFARILRTTMAFFDTNPVGRVLNRFSKDVGQIDDRLPWTMFEVIQASLLSIGIVLMTAVLNPWIFISEIPLLVLFFMLRRYYVQTSRSVKRLEGTTRSPVFSHLSATLQGLHTIRAMHMEQKLTAEFHAHQDLHTEAWFLFITTSRWFGVRIDWLSILFTASVVYCSVLAADAMDPGFVGLSVVYTLNLMGRFQWAVRQSVELENQMISVERVLQYTRLPKEADLESKPDHKPPDTWPSSGSLQAKSVSLKYSPSAPFVLRDVSFDIHGGEKIGIVGRTGAGKSSLITTLFRLAEPEGELTIDGVSIHSLGLHDLRNAISIIPQDPVLFTGSVRRNLDPFDEYSDSQLWRALEEVQLKDAITSNPENLYMEVTEGGSNFSAGQRQLMCLARAVLGNTRILMIDEATANVDPITDELIQQTIRNKFKVCTVLTIAHRLHTVIDSDRIMVLDAGKIVEMDTPANLLSLGQTGVFYAMVEQLGKTQLDHLTEQATKKQYTLSLKPPRPLDHAVGLSSPTPISESTSSCPPEFLLATGEVDASTSTHQHVIGFENEAFTSENTRL